MYDIKEVINPNEKTQITLDIMLALPKWFSPKDDIEKKSIIHKKYPFFAVYDKNKVIGFVVLKIHNEYTAEIFNLGILEEYHRKGIGKRLIDNCLNYCRNYKYEYLTVKTLDEFCEYEPYDNTRAFYYKMGFIPLEVLKTFWNEDNPCLFLVKNVS